MRIAAYTHDNCACHSCSHVAVYPELPSLTPVPDMTDNWTVDCHWRSQLVKGRAVLIDRGFATDGASIPRIAWRLIGHPWSKDLLPHALAHDALYAGELLDRKACDRWFLDSMTLAGVGLVKRNAIYAAVRVGGGCVWSKHTAEGVAAARRDARLAGPLSACVAP